MDGQRPPVVVGGTGGSGTRVFARALMHAGLYMGANRNVQEDAIEFAPWIFRWGPRFILANQGNYEFSEDEDVRMRNQFAAALDRHLAPMEDPAAPWGWKHPPSCHLLPYLEEKLPGLRYVHVIRDGRDFAFRDTGGARAHSARLGLAVLDDDPDPAVYGQAGWDKAKTGDDWTNESPARKALFWARVHATCADYGEQHLGDRYLRIRFEDICAHPERVLPELFAFAQADGASPEGIMQTIQAPPTVGSWKQQDPAALESVLDAAGPQLARFGYVD